MGGGCILWRRELGGEGIRAALASPLTSAPRPIRSRAQSSSISGTAGGASGPGFSAPSPFVDPSRARVGEARPGVSISAVSRFRGEARGRVSGSARSNSFDFVSADWGKRFLSRSTRTKNGPQAGGGWDGAGL